MDFFKIKIAYNLTWTLQLFKNKNLQDLLICLFRGAPIRRFTLLVGLCRVSRGTYQKDVLYTYQTKEKERCKILIKNL